MTDDIHFQTIGEVAAKLRSGAVTSSGLTELMLTRVERHNPTLNAFITVTSEQARDAARQSDAELAAGQDRGPLHGIPIALKDLIDTAGVRTTYGSKLFEDHVPAKDATVVRRLREAGAVPLGKTGLHEFAYGTSSINPFYGAIGNPWAPDHDPGGSSGGSASAVAAGLAYAALGTDTGCSIRQPAHCCGITGFKPSFGAVSKAGVFPLVWTMDHIGPLTRSAGDAAAVHAAISGYDPDDPYTALAPPSGPENAGTCNLAGKRLGVVRRFFFDGHDDVIEVVDAALQSLSDRGAILVELDIPDIEDADIAAGATFSEALAIHQKDLTAHPDAYSAEVRQKLKKHQATTAAEYAQAQYFRRGFVERMENLMNACDVLVCPTATITSAPIAARPRDYTRHASKNTEIFDFTGQPSISVPCGFTAAGLPVGLMLTGRRGADHAVLNIAAAVERETDWRRNPSL
jgi:aspartyl-tRNA(Asn)/glutamyl-tRNA(Gln) amidotransferase subunit A